MNFLEFFEFFQNASERLRLLKAQETIRLQHPCFGKSFLLKFLIINEPICSKVTGKPFKFFQTKFKIAFWIIVTIKT